MDERLLHQIQAMFVEDQYLRSPKAREELQQGFVEHAQTVHGNHNRAIKEIYTHLGNRWPNTQDMNAKTLNHFAILIIHQFGERDALAPEDAALFKTYAPHLKTLCKSQIVPRDLYAVLKDKIRYSKNRPQIYGTQLGDQRVQQHDKVDRLRAKLGMETLAAYRARHGK